MLPDTNEGILFIVGALFFLIGLIGGGLEISAIKIPPISKVARFFVLIMGTLLMAAALYRFMAPAAAPAPTPTLESSPTAQPTPVPSETAVPTNTVAAVPTNTEPAVPTNTEPAVLTETPAPTTATGSARIDNVWVEPDVVQFGSEGMLIHIDFAADGLEGVPCQAVAYFYFGTGEALVDHNGEFNTVDNAVAVYKNFTPVYPSAEFNDFTLFMPYDELELPDGEHLLKFFVTLYDSSSTHLTSSPYVEFTYTQ